MAGIVNHFDPSTFEKDWEELTEEDKIQWIEQSHELPPEHAILPVVAGIVSYHFSVRNTARDALEQIQSQVSDLLGDPWHTDHIRQGLKASESVCARLYVLIRPELSLKELNYFFKLLLETRGKGPYYAFKAFYKGVIFVSSLKKIMVSVSDSGKLAFVDQYLQASPFTRLKFGRWFRKILEKISDRESVVRFYADLYDQQRDADPFLNNIDFALRNPATVIKTELTSDTAEVKIIGLKALSMMNHPIPPEVLLEILSTERVKKVRLIIYSIIENTTQGMYAEMFYPLLEILYKSDKDEALCVFRALVVTGKQPVHALFDLVRQNYPAMIPDILTDISTLSKISFFVIQDIALNKEKYLGANFEVNMACVLGMIKKRPERVVRILKTHDDATKDHLRIKITRFIEKTRQLLADEKKDIETEFNPAIQAVKEASDPSKGLFSTLFSNPVEKNILTLKENKTTQSLDFTDEHVKDYDLSGLDFLPTPLYFSRTVIHNCDLSNSVFVKSYFKNAVFYNVNMEAAQFEDVNFDRAIFINVNARQTVFQSCSFQHASVFNCNFNDAQILDTSFFDSKISKTSFNRTRIFCTSFSFSKISAVSFATSTIDQADFSFAQARFCRLPHQSKAVIRTDHIEFNARKHQLSFNDLPDLDEGIVKDIDILTFSEFIHYGEAKFLKQNKLSLLTAFDIFKNKQADLFQIIPILLHTHIEFPGLTNVDSLTPVGITGFSPSKEAVDILKKYTSVDDDFPVSETNARIDGLFTIGSVGSIAQTSDSDIDYWVCINETKYSTDDSYLLDKKLESLEKMASEEFNTQVTFFKVDIVKAKNNDFGDSSTESSGSAQSRILKEEFYRTMIHIAGKIPLWAVLPTAISLHYYNTILEHTGEMPNLSRYIDLGDIHAISPSEFYGASIWQMFKWLKSPFKSVIKMALLEKYIFAYGKETLLCNTYKDAWMNSGEQLNLAQNDSYYILLKDLLDYYGRAKDTKSVSLLLTCFFLKIEIKDDRQIDRTVFGMRKILLERCIEKWGWNKEKIFEIGTYKTWPYSQIANLSVTIEKYMVKKYKTLNKAFDRLFHGMSQISPEDRTVLGRKVYTEFSTQPGKVQKILLISRSVRHFKGLHLQYHNPDNRVGSWRLLNRDNRTFHKAEEELVKANTIEEIGAWLINNRLYHEESTINMIPNPTYVTYDDIRKLYAAMNDFFAPKLNQVIGFDALLEKSRVVELFISVNFYAPRQENRIIEYTAVYLNSWGEMLCKSVYKKGGFPSVEAAKQDMTQRIGVDELPEDTAFYFSKGLARKT